MRRRVPSERYLVFTAESGEAGPEAPLPDGYRVELWRPSWAHPAPPGRRAARLYACWLMHETYCFRNREYGALIIRADRQVAHRTLMLPPYFVFPFMNPGDLQIGYTATDEAHRGRGLAAFAIREIVRRLGRPGRRFWYLTEESNVASVRAAKRAGLSLVAEGIRRDRLRVRALGYFALTAAAEHS